MGKKSTINTYIKGLNRDLDKHEPQNQNLYWNQNFRLITQEGQSNKILENVKGNITLKDISLNSLKIEDDEKIIGHYVFTNKDIVIFALATWDYNNYHEYPARFRIYLFKHKENNVYYSRILLYEDNNNYLQDVGFNIRNTLQCVGREENEYLRKIYWIDGLNILRFIKIEPDKDIQGNYKDSTIQSSYTNIQNQQISDFDMIGDYDISSTNIEFIKYGNGNLLCGKVQYAIRFFNKNGNSTIYNINPQLFLIPAKYGDTNLDLEGGEVNQNSGKSIMIKITDNVNSLKYDYVELIGIYYFDQNPIVKLINRYEANKIINGIDIIDDGNTYIDDLSIEELTMFTGLYIPQTLEIKNNRLFIGNIKEKKFDVDFDARAYRFLFENNQWRSKIYNENYSTNYEIIYDPYFDSYSTIPPETFDCVNPYNDLELQKNNDSKFKKYNMCATRGSMGIGGNGPNIKYHITTNNHILDVNQEGSTQWDNPQFVSYNGNIRETYNKQNELYYLGVYRGFQRDEIYRFGIIFFDKKGQSSFVKWIGDIRMPSTDEINISNNNGTTALNLSLNFYIDPLKIPKDTNGNPLSYQIVYVKRGLNDRTILTAGYLTDLYYPTDSYDIPYNETNRILLFGRYLTGWESNNHFPNYRVSHEEFEYVSPDIDMNELDLSNTYLNITNNHLYKSLSLHHRRPGLSSDYINIFTKYYNSNGSFGHINKFYSIKNTLILNTQDNYRPGTAVLYKIGEQSHFTTTQGSLDSHKFAYYVPTKYNLNNKIITPLTAMCGIQWKKGDNNSSSCGYFVIVNYANIMLRSVMTQYMNMIRPFVINTKDWITLGEDYDTICGQNLYETNTLYSYIRKLIKPYNGYSYISRTLNHYIPVSFIMKNQSANCMFGDTYIGYYDRMRQGITSVYADRQYIGKEYTWGSVLNVENSGFVQNSSVNKYIQSQGYSSFNSFIVETSVIIPLMHGLSVNKYIENTDITYVTDQNNIKNIITDNVIENDIENGSNESFKTPRNLTLVYPDMFLYNGIYSKLNDLKVYFHKPQIYDNYNIYSTSIKWSQSKFDTELYDSFLIFKPNDTYKVSDKYGEIKQLLYWKNFLFNFQERGMCILPINEKTALNTNLGSAVIIGEGDLIGSELNYAQGSDKYGLQLTNKAITTESGIYWIDNYHKTMLVYNGQTNELIIPKGLFSWFKDNILETTLYVSGYDPIYKEVLFSLNIQFNTQNKFTKTLVYNEIIQAYQGIYSFQTDRFINNPELISIKNGILWIHNYGLRTNWYNSLINDPSYIEIIINDESMLPKEFNNIQYMSESFNYITKQDNINDTLNLIQASNDFLQSEEIDLRVYQNGDTLYVGGLRIPNTAPSTVKNIRRRERMWHTVIPRVLATQDIDNHRMRDSYVKLKLQYNNTNNNIFRLHYITTFYSFAYNNE